MSTKIRQYGEGIETRDGQMLVRDTTVNGGFRITPDTRILPESAPEIKPGGLGVRRTGTPGPAPTQVEVDVDKITTSIIKGLGLLSAADLAKVKATLARFCGSGSTSQVGITSTSNDGDPLTVSQADRVASINDRNREFWDKKTEADERRLYGR
jgi:hypothetical protein